LISKLRTASGLSAAEFMLVLEAWLRLLWIDLTLRLLPFPRWRQTLLAATRSPATEPPTYPPVSKRFLSLFGIAVRNHWRPMNCLRRSLALHGMLTRRGVPCVLRLGVRKEHQQLSGHAWLECGDVVVNDAPDVARHYAVVYTEEALQLAARQSASSQAQD
jgi:hypothetical protein